MKKLHINTRKTQITLATAAGVLKIEVNNDDGILNFATEILPIYFGSCISLYCSNQGQPYTGVARADDGESYIMSLFPLRARLKSETPKQENGKEVGEETKNKTIRRLPASLTTSTPAAMLRFQSLKGNKEIKMLLNIYDMAKIRTWACMNIDEEDVDFFGSYIVQTKKDGLHIKTGGRPLIKVSKNVCPDFARMLSLACMGIPNSYTHKNISLYYDRNQNVTVLSIGGYRSTPSTLSLHRMMLHCERYVYLDEGDVEKPKVIPKGKTAASKKPTTKQKKAPNKKGASAKKKLSPKSEDVPQTADQPKSKEAETITVSEAAA